MEDFPRVWLLLFALLVDREHAEIAAVANKVFPLRKDNDEFSLHTHFKWFIMDSPDDFESFKIVCRRMNWLMEARAEIERNGLPKPLGFRYGGGDSNDTLYDIEELICLHDGPGIKNYLSNPDRLPQVIGIRQALHKGNNVWTIEGGREIILLTTSIYLDEEFDSVIAALDRRLENEGYAISGSHDDPEVVPKHFKKRIEYLHANYKVRFVTIIAIGEMVRKGKIRNE